MKKLLVLLVVIASLFITGCTDEGILRLLNYSMEEIWYTINGGGTEWLDSGYQVEYGWDLDDSLFGSEDKKVTVQYGGDYWWWYDYEVTKTVKPGKTVDIDIIGDAGEIEIENNSNTFWIEEVYLAPSSDPYWGDDDLIGDIGPGESVIWKVTTGNWDIKVVDDWGDEFVAWDQYVGPEETLVFDYDGFKRTTTAAADKRANAAKYTEFIEDLCEQREK
ncbi:MAG: hypothetical protein K9N09_11285 [Candidatus Cloacimonetes bacterium]|nr:hypothetical protein [Candidatus Cloacimonadota bacterium]MCF7815012.1 hypothetical protein [Candidatus Cloacimonadota bacterium]MCF7869267.1 hypothetical protein [Candidatus Cloacimonadota bacterium]